MLGCRGKLAVGRSIGGVGKCVGEARKGVWLGVWKRVASNFATLSYIKIYIAYTKTRL